MTSWLRSRRCRGQILVNIKEMLWSVLVKIKEVPWPVWLRGAVASWLGSQRCRGQLVRITEVPLPVG